MRIVQVVLFVLGVLCFLSSLGFVGSQTGDILWRAGMATLVTDMLCVMLWPRSGGGAQQ
jgi:hypothetical protein